MSALAAPGVRVLLAAAVLAVVPASCGDGPPSAVSVDTAAPSATGATAPPDTVPSTLSAPATVSVPATATPAAAEPAASEPATPALPLTPGEDQADRYLGDTSEVYRRTLADGSEVVARMSSATYASVFAIGWYAPTGTADTCLGDHALFLGVPGRAGWWGSAWTVAPWFDEQVPTGAVRFLHTMPAVDATGGDPSSGAQLLLVQTAPDATEVVLASADGHEVDRALVVDGLAVLRYDTASDPNAPFADLVTVVGADGASDEAMLTTDDGSARPACGPGEAPERLLPDAGVQPPDASAARTSITDRLSALVDTSVPWDAKPTGLLDDDTGVAAAVAGLAASPFSEVVASAAYAIDELVFTAPDAAWFRYTITTSASTWPDRFGQAVLRDGTWRITRTTLCQDLALAASPCSPDPGTVELPPDPEWEAAWQAWVAKASMYTAGDGCPPLSPC